jgi:hypothetical protein
VTAFGYTMMCEVHESLIDLKDALGQTILSGEPARS